MPLICAHESRHIENIRRSLYVVCRSRGRAPAGTPARVQAKPAAPQGSIAMLDVIYLLIGAVFLGACVLYAYACDRL